MSKWPSMDEFVSASSHDGPLWRHAPSLREWLAIGLLWSVFLATVRSLGFLPEPPREPFEWIVTFAIGLIAFVPPFVAVEVVYHRRLNR